jgi:hypothetical protein
MEVVEALGLFEFLPCAVPERDGIVLEREHVALTQSTLRSEG